MASGILTSIQPPVDTDTVAYTIPTGKLIAATISAVSISGPSNVRIAISTSSSSSPYDKEYIEYEAQLPQIGSVLERTGLILDAGKKIILRSSGRVSFSIYGYEEAV